MSEELQSLVQIIELYGRGLGGLGKAIRFSAKSAEKGVDIAKVKVMQHKMKLHYASTGEHKTMKLKDLEKLTGGQYNILNIPLEEEKGLTGFYDRLKKMHVSFAELPDLQLGDGYTQIAYNPMDAENVRMVVQYFKKKFPTEARDIDIEEYINMAGKDGQKLLDELAKKGYTAEMHREQLSEIQERIKDNNYIPISLNMESLLLREEKDGYTLRVPRSRTKSNTEHAIYIKKSDVILMDQGQTLISYIKKSDMVTQYPMDSHGAIMEDRPHPIKGEAFAEAFQPVGEDRLQNIEKLKPNLTEIFPSFNQGQENETHSLAPVLMQEEIPQKAEKQMTEILSIENLKERQNNADYIPLTFNMEKQLVAEDSHVYTTSLLRSAGDEPDRMKCMVINKADARLSEDGKRLSAYLKKTDTSRILEFDQTGIKVGEYQMKNEEIALAYLKSASSWKPGEHKLNHKDLPDVLEKNGFKPLPGKKVK